MENKFIHYALLVLAAYIAFRTFQYFTRPDAPAHKDGTPVVAGQYRL